MTSLEPSLEPSPEPTRDADDLFDYVDRLVDGQPATPTTGLERTAWRIHVAAGPGMNAAFPHTRRSDLWSDIMQTVPRSTAPATTPGHRIPDRWTPPRWNAVANGVLAAALVLALVAGFWRYGDIPGIGNSPGNDDNDGAQFAAQTGEATPENGTPGVERPGVPRNQLDPRLDPPLADEPPISMPTAADCTVEPLTVSEVLAIVDDPSAASRTPIYIIEEASHPQTDFGFLHLGQPPSQNILDEIAATHFEYMACAMTGDWFRVWALSDPSLVYRDVVDQLYPTYITREDARKMLEELRDTGRSGGLPYLPERFGNFTYVELVHPEPTSSVATSGRDEDTPVDVYVGTVIYTADGQKLEDSERSISSENAADPMITYFQYVWSVERDRWLLFEGRQRTGSESG